ncbi:unnamed protein product [Paramecium sonneborni]|uniref:Transmembrane protein n=1 Tax=Paramecium sonneborni TaxID=65129 RepID=A0A8S1RNW1_9CILI|nr:unnamed protein product [Paramecium sonneborni]
MNSSRDYVVDQSLCFLICIAFLWHIYSWRKIKRKKQKIDQVLRVTEKYLCQQMKISIINSLFNEKNFNHQNEFFLKDFQEKEVQKFIGTLIKHSLVLKKFVNEDLKHHLKLLIQKQNQQLQRIVNENKYKLVTNYNLSTKLFRNVFSQQRFLKFVIHCQHIFQIYHQQK